MDPIVNIFTGDAFSASELSLAIDLVPIKWGRLGQLGLFPDDGVPTTSVTIEFRNNTLVLLPQRARGGPSSMGSVGRRFAKNFIIPHIPHEDEVTGDEIQNIRAFGSAQMLESSINVVNRKLITMANKHDITLEHMRAGMMLGKLLDFDGTVILNTFTEFNVTEPVVFFDWAGGTVDDVAASNKVKRYMEDQLMGDTLDHIHAFCSPGFWDKFITSAAVVDSYKLYTALLAQNPLRDDLRKGFVWQDIVWEEYRAKAGYEAADGTITTAQFIPDGDCRFVPMGTMQTMKTYHAPPTFLDTANLPPGLKRYAKAAPDKWGKRVDLYSESNPLPLCVKPLCLIRGNIGTGATNI